MEKYEDHYYVEIDKAEDADEVDLFKYDEEPDNGDYWDEEDYYDFPEDNEDGLFDPMEKEDIP